MSVYWGVIGGRERKEGVSGWKEQHAKNIFAAGRGYLEVVLGEKKKPKTHASGEKCATQLFTEMHVGNARPAPWERRDNRPVRKKKTGKDQLGGATDL